MRGMKPHENAGIVDWPSANIADWTSKPELEAQHKIVELLGCIKEDGMISNHGLHALIVD